MSDNLALRPEDYPSGRPGLVPPPSSAGLAPGSATTEGFEHALDDTAGASSAGTSSASAAGAAKEQARATAEDAKAQAQSVAATATEETKAVVEQAKTQLQDLLWQSRSELSQQADGQQRRLAEGLRSFGQELDEMTSGTERQGLAAEAASQLSGRIAQAADFLDERDFSGVLDEVTGFARRRPGAFLLGAALLGVVAGRLTRGLTADSRGSAPSTAGLADTVEPTRYEGVPTDLAPRVAPYGTEAVPTAYAPIASPAVGPVTQSEPVGRVDVVEVVDVPYASPDEVSEPPRSGAFPTGAAQERLA